MKEKIKQLRLNISFSAAISILIGVLLLIFPDESLTTISKVLAAVVILSGISIIISQLFESRKNMLGVIVGAVLLLIGVWIFTVPEAIVSIIPIAIGVILVVHGVQDLSMSFEVLKTNANHKWIPFLLAVVNIAMGILCIFKAFNVLAFAVRVIGIMLIYDGLVDFGILHKVRKYSNNVIDTKITSEEDI